MKRFKSWAEMVAVAMEEGGRDATRAEELPQPPMMSTVSILVQVGLIRAGFLRRPLPRERSDCMGLPPNSTERLA